MYILNTDFKGEMVNEEKIESEIEKHTDGVGVYEKSNIFAVREIIGGESVNHDVRGAEKLNEE